MQKHKIFKRAYPTTLYCVILALALAPLQAHAMRYAQSVVLAAMKTTPPSQKRLKVTADMVTKKAGFVKLLITTSQSAKMMETSDNAEGKAQLAKAHATFAEASVQLENGEFAKADTLLDATIVIMTETSRMLSGDTLTSQRNKHLYDRRLKSVRAFLSKLLRLTKELEEPVTLVENLASLESRVAEIEAIAASGDMDTAKTELDKTYKTIRLTLKSIRDGSTLVRTLDFSKPEDEWAYEVGRNNQYLELIQTLKEDGRMKASSEAMVTSLQKRAKEQRKEARKLATDKQWVKAIDTLLKSTGTLKRAIQTMGIFIPG